MMTGIPLAPAPSQEVNAFGNLITLNWLEKGDRAMIKALKRALKAAFDMNGKGHCNGDSGGQQSAKIGSSGDCTKAEKVAFSLVWHSSIRSEIPDRPDLILQVGGDSASQGKTHWTRFWIASTLGKLI